MMMVHLLLWLRVERLHVSFERIVKLFRAHEPRAVLRRIHERHTSLPCELKKQW
jgi:hypothetical protein